MADLTVIWWRDIPAQVVAKQGRTSAKVPLSPRFQEAIDMAATRVGLIGTDEYLNEWRRVTRECGDDLDAEAAKRSARAGAGVRRFPVGIAGAIGRHRRRGGIVTDTVVSSATKEVVIGSGRPFVIIGERINPTGRKKLAEEMKAGDFSTVIDDTVNQVEAGAHMLDVNAGIPLADEPAILAETVKLVQSLTDVPLSIDSSIVAALEAGLEVYEGKPLVNSVTGEDERLEQVLPLVAKYGAAVVAITNDETGISEDPDVRFAVAEKIVHAAADHGIAAADVVVDPLVMPIGALGGAGRQVFSLVRRLHDELGVNSTCGASNVSFGLPDRNRLNGAFLAMAISNGLTSAITSPLHDEVREAVMAADVMMGNDQDCNAWIAKHREQPAGGTGRRGGRAGRRGAGADGGPTLSVVPDPEATPEP